MFQFGSCPRCQSELSPERLQFQPIVCDVCGYTHNTLDNQVTRQFEKRFIKVSMILASVLTMGFLQAATWDKYAVEIIPLKLKQLIGMTSGSDLNRIAQICMERLRHDCVETAFASRGYQGDNEAFADLGKYQVRRQKRQDAMASFQRYFQNNGQDLEAMYQFAKVLGDAGQVDQAIAYYDQVLKAKPDTLQITVTQNYVKMLTNHGRAAQALALIDGIRKTGSSASLFMETEYKSLKLQQAAR